VRDFVEKYFLDTPEGPKSLDTSTFLEGGIGNVEERMADFGGVDARLLSGMGGRQTCGQSA
ncbi:hypothetical protein, partial [Geobacillus stearothermophilus]|uniref:hypothetical protein n=1 Tax=Geobacillus stearothermophilus TaxID=1422 RepID=UPI001E4D1B70